MDAGDAGADADAADAMMAPVPSCYGSSAMCEQNDAGLWMGASIITCEGVYFVGPWNLLLERQVLSQFEVVQTQAVGEPGFGTTFYDTGGPPVQLTYRVCVVDSYGTRCGMPFTTAGPVNCACEPLTCAYFLACNTQLEDGCGHTITCGDCTNGVACNPDNDTCCPPGFMGDGDGICVCAPPPGEKCGDWNVLDCKCEPTEG